MDFLAFLEYLEQQQLISKKQFTHYWTKVQNEPERFPLLFLQEKLFTKVELKQHLKNFQIARKSGLFKETIEPATFSDSATKRVSESPTEFNSSPLRAFSDSSALPSDSATLFDAGMQKQNEVEETGPSATLLNASMETITSSKNVPKDLIQHFQSRLFRLQDVFLQLPRKRRYFPLEKKPAQEAEKVKDIWVEREVQLKKIVPPSVETLFSSSEEHYERYSAYFLFQEALITAQLEHPQILPLYDYQENKEGIVFTLRQVYGENLATLFQQVEVAKQYPQQKRILLFFKICDAIAYAHSRGFIHRFLQPEHLYLGAFGEVYVSHWKFAIQIPTTHQKQFMRQLPIPEWIIVPPAEFFPKELKNSTHCAPEVSEKQEVRIQEDIYALGKILEEWLCWGDEPKNLSKDLQAILKKASHPDWEQRYTSVALLQEDLFRYQRNLRISIRDYSLPEIIGMWVKRHPFLVGIGVVIGAMFFFLLFWEKSIFLQKQQEQYDEALQLALREKEQAHLFTHRPAHIEQLSHLLRALNYLNLALSLQPQDALAEQEKYTVGKLLIRSCEQLEYDPLAHYVAYELSGLSFVSETEKNILLQQLTQKKETRRQENLRYLETSLVQLRKNPQEKQLRANLLYELSQMKDSQILENLCSLVEEQTTRLLENPRRYEQEDYFYEALTFFIGYLGKEDGADFLLQELHKMEAQMSEIPLNERPLGLVTSMVHLASGLGYTRLHAYALPLQEIRYRLEADHLFWSRTEKAYKNLLDLDYLKAQTFSDAYSYTMRGLERYSAGDITGAIEDYNEGIRLNPQNITAYNNRGLAKQTLKLYDEAIADYNQVLLILPQDIAAYQNRGFSYYEKHEYQKALADWEEVIRLSPSQAEHYANRGNAKKSLEDYMGALADYNKALELQPNLPEVYMSRGQVKLILKDHSGALADADYALKLNEFQPILYNARGVIKKELNDFEGAILDYSRAISIAPDEPMFYLNRGSTKKLLGDLEGALADVQDALRLNPKYASPYYLRGLIRKEQGDLNGALRDFDQMLYLNKNDAWGYHQRGQVKMSKRLFDDALKDLDEAIRLNPMLENAYIDRSAIKIELRQFASALEDLHITLKLNANHAIAHFNRGFIYRAMGKHEEAIADLSRYLELVAHLNDGKTRNNRETIWKQFPELKK